MCDTAGAAECLPRTISRIVPNTRKDENWGRKKVAYLSDIFKKSSTGEVNTGIGLELNTYPPFFFLPFELHSCFLSWNLERPLPVEFKFDL